MRRPRAFDRAKVPQRRTKFLLFVICCFAVGPMAGFAIEGSIELKSFQSAQISGFSTWRPYSNPNRLISVGMNKGDVLTIAGKPDYEESYYQSGGGRLIRISDWYYVQSGFDAQTTILKFAEERLVSITTNLTR